MMGKGAGITTITGEGLKGEWFYLEEEQPLDRAAMNYYVLRSREVRIGEAAEVVGTYII